MLYSDHIDKGKTNMKDKELRRIIDVRVKQWGLELGVNQQGGQQII